MTLQAGSKGGKHECLEHGREDDENSPIDNGNVPPLTGLGLVQHSVKVGVAKLVIWSRDLML